MTQRRVDYTMTQRRVDDTMAQRKGRLYNDTKKG